MVVSCSGSETSGESGESGLCNGSRRAMEMGKARGGIKLCTPFVVFKRASAIEIVQAGKGGSIAGGNCRNDVHSGGSPKQVAAQPPRP